MASCYMRTSDKKRRIEEIIDGYGDARRKEFSAHLADFIDDYTENGVLEVDECEVQAFLDRFDSEYPDEDTWAWKKLDEEISDCEDQRYEEMKDREIGL